MHDLEIESLKNENARLEWENAYLKRRLADITCDHEWELYCERLGEPEESVEYNLVNRDFRPFDKTPVEIVGKHITKCIHYRVYVCKKCGNEKYESKMEKL